MDDFFRKRAFDIGELPENIDLDSPPVTGFDYLYRVRLESKKCPKVVVSDIDPAQFVCHQTVKVDFCSGFIRASPGFQPDIKWQETQVNHFSKTREDLRNNRNVLTSKFPKRQYPDVNQRESWCVFTLGKETYQQICGRKKQTDEDKDGAPKRKKSRIAEDRYPPLLSIILYLSQPNIIRLIKYHIEWLKSIKFTHNQGEWLYALLLNLEKPLDPDTCDLLRSLSRVCSSLRSDLLEPDDDAVTALNILITIISHYFDQRDMSDDFLNEEIKSKEN